MASNRLNWFVGCFFWCPEYWTLCCLLL